MAENNNERRDFLQQAAKAGGAAGLAALALAVPSQAAGGKIEKTPAGLKIGNLVFTSGLTGVEGEFGGTVEDQTRRTLEKHKKALEAAGSSLDNVLKVVVYMADIKVEKTGHEQRSRRVLHRRHQAVALGRRRRVSRLEDEGRDRDDRLGSLSEPTAGPSEIRNSPDGVRAVVLPAAGSRLARAPSVSPESAALRSER